MGHDIFNNGLAREVIDAASEVYHELGPGFPTPIYSAALEGELRDRRVPFTSMEEVPVMYKNQLLGLHHLDLVVGEFLVVELRTAGELDETDVAQAVSHLKASNKCAGVILNFANREIEVKCVAI